MDIEPISAAERARRSVFGTFKHTHTLKQTANYLLIHIDLYVGLQISKSKAKTALSYDFAMLVTEI